MKQCRSTLIHDSEKYCENDRYRYRSNGDERRDIDVSTHDRLHSRLELIEYIGVTDS